MTLEEYLDHLTEENWHTLRELIELERGNLTPLAANTALAAYSLTIAHMNNN
jgi:hypothetical protein